MKKTKQLNIAAAVFFTFFAFTGCNGAETDTNFPQELLEVTGDENYKSPENVEVSDAVNQMWADGEGAEKLWWKETSFYHIWIKSFKDSDVDDCSKNCGDFKGIEDSLDYIKDDLGCTGIWLSPFFECSYKESTNEASAKINMHGYDIQDYYKVNPYFGTGDGSNAEEELISLINACHSKGIKIIFDFVPNHTSSENQWFKNSCSKEDGKEDWYIWNSSALDWKTNTGYTGWTKVNSRNEYYYHAFPDNQPDLNYRNVEVREEMKNVVRYWLNKGFDGLRIDAVRYLVETPESAMDTDETHKWFQELREVVDAYSSPKFMVCEAWIENDRNLLNQYFGTEEKPEFNMVLDFDQGWNCIDSVNLEYDFCLSERYFTPEKESNAYGTFLGNHDEYHNRLGDYFGEGTKRKSIAATALSLLRPTTSFIYYGNEIGQASVGTGDFKLRKPFKWDLAESEISESDSLLNVNKKLINLKNNYKNLFAYGKVQKLNNIHYYKNSNGIFYEEVGYIISDGTDDLLVAVNLTSTKKDELDFNCIDITKNYSMLVGNSDSELDTGIKYNEAGYISIQNLMSFEVRVYDLNSDSKENILDIWN